MAERPHVYVFGAGHVGDALAMALSLVPVRIVLVDTREDELSASTVPGIETCLTAMPEAVVRDAPAGSAFVILTHDHALDFLIAAEALRRDDAAYVGMIGSKTKRATFKNWLSREIGRPGTVRPPDLPDRRHGGEGQAPGGDRGAGGRGDHDGGAESSIAGQSRRASRSATASS